MSETKMLFKIIAKISMYNFTIQQLVDKTV